MNTPPRNRILVVEDSVTQAHHLRLILQDAGFDVAVVTNGADALAALASPDAGGIALVMSDVVMPQISGYDLCRQIKSRVEGQSVPVILLTALEKPTDIVQGLACGADNFLRKPFDPAYLLERVRHVLAAPRRRQPLAESEREPLHTSFMGREISVACGREQILEFLLSTFADYVRANDREREIKAVESAQRMELERAKAREEYVSREKEALDEARRILEQTLEALSPGSQPAPGACTEEVRSRPAGT